MDIKEEQYPRVLEEVIPLTIEHWQEFEEEKAHETLNPDFSQYQSLYTAGLLKIITVRDNGVLVGYSAWIIQKALHYSYSFHAVSDLIYLKKEYRKGLTGYKAVKEMIEIIKGSGVNRISIGDGNNKGLAKILGRLGFKPAQVTHEMRISK